tara:strand:- start:36349 stop:41973 length:5625 start_codon:yes stop_codon:yes gene_type:complete
MLKKILCLLSLLFIASIARPITFQLYVYDTANQEPLNTTDVVAIQSSFVDANGVVYFETSQDQQVSNGILHMTLDLDLSDGSQLMAFDQPGMQIKVNLLDDELLMPLESMPLSIGSNLSDRTFQINDPDLMTIQYNEGVVNIGGGRSTENALHVNGVLTADYFKGDGEFIYNVVGSGFNDDHSLERNFSRSCPPNVSRPECSYGNDVLYISSTPFVGINTTQPKMLLDMVGTVLFTKGQDNVGGLTFPLKKHQSLMAWDHSSAAFRAGYVSRDASVSAEGFSRSSVSIGRDVFISGRNSSVIGGQGHDISGNFSSILGGEQNSVTGNYSVLVGARSDQIHKSYVSTIGGESNIVSSNYSVLLSSSFNTLGGEYITIMGKNNLVNGESVFVYGDNNQINSNHTIVMGNSSLINHDNSWVVNVSSTVLAQTTNPNQVIWMADQGVSINTDDYSESLVVGGDLMASMIYGDGSQLTNVSAVDKYWLMVDNIMTNENYSLGIGTSLKRNNRINLRYGLTLSSDGSTRPGTMAYEHGDLIGYGETATHSLLVQDTDTVYNVSSEFLNDNNVLYLSTANAMANDYLVFTGQAWEPKVKSLWVDSSSFLSYSRPVSLWKNQSYFGRLTMAHPTLNHMVFSDATHTQGMSLNVAGLKDNNQVFAFGFNIKDIEEKQPFNVLNDSFLFHFDSLNGGIVIQNLTNSLMEIDRYTDINFFDHAGLMDINIPTKTRVESIVIDDGDDSEMAHVNFIDDPFISVNSAGRIRFQTPETATINLRILPPTYDSLLTQTRLQVTDRSEVILSHQDGFSVGQPMLTIPEGNMLIDVGYGIGVFDSDGSMKTGGRIFSDAVVFTPDSSGLNRVYFHDIGFGVRTTPDQLVVIQDNDVSMLVKKSPQDDASSLVFSKQMLPKWTIQSGAELGASTLVIRNAQAIEILKMNQKILINSPNSPSKEISMNGNLTIMDSNLQLTPMSGSDNPTNAIPFVFIDDAQLRFSPLIDSVGFEIHSDGTQQMKFQHSKVSFGSTDVPSSPTNSAYVRQGAFISDRLMLNDEHIEFKTIRTPTNRFIHDYRNQVQRLSFDFDSGFDISTPSDNAVVLTFLDHFSNMSSVSANIVITPNTQIITPNGIDMMSFLGDNISIQANNVDSEGDPDGSMDSLTFYNDLMNGGTINGDLLISATLNFIGNDSDGVVNGFEGDISNMFNIPFPWHHTVTENGELVHYEYVITENVGIGLTNPQYPLQVAGVTSMNIAQSPSINVQKDFVSNKDYLNMVADGNEFNVTVNSSGMMNDSVLQWSGARLTDNIFGLNGFNTAYTMSLYPKSEGVNADLYIEGRERARFTLHEAFDLLSDASGDMHVTALGSVNDLIFMNPSTSLYVSTDQRLGIGMFKKPQNSLDVSGNMVIGSSLAGTIQAPQNSVMVQGKLGVGTRSPDAYADVQGSVVVAESDGYLGAITGLSNDLVVETKLFIDELDPSMTESMLVNGDMLGIGNVYFNKTANAATSELAFFNDSDSRVAIGYGQSKTDRSLAISGKTYVKLTPKYNIKGIYIDSAKRVALGHDAPESLFHAKKNNISMKLEATGNGDSTVKFESGKNGLMGISSAVQSQFLLSDGENLQTAGSDVSIDSAGNVDIGYNLANSQTVQPTHSVRVDINGKINAGSVLENGQVLTHMPEGSIIMWSGYMSQLPDGWELCDGTTTCPQNLEGYFVLGKSSGQTVGEDAGVDTFSVATSSDYSHKHVSNHTHGGFTSTAHGHNDLDIGDKNDTTYTSGNDVPSGTSSVGQSGYTETWEECWWIDLFGLFCEEKSRWHDYPSHVGYNGPSTSNGHHNHSVTINHGHNSSVSNDTHSHTLADQSHEHANATHDHTVDNEPIYYQLAFIYLKGEG